MKAPLFHSGELDAQRRAGVSDLVQRVGPRMIRDHLTEQHRQFFQELPFIVVGHRDEHEALWADLLAGAPGFTRAGDARHLEIWSRDVSRLRLRSGADIGILGIQPETRRRNRENGVVQIADGESLVIEILQSYGNCPQYITPRQVTFDQTSSEHHATTSSFLGAFSDEMTQLISSADTFFIATGHGRGAENAALGIDVSHRGGKAGFIQIEEEGALSIPDYSGNNLFNTVGNLTRDPRAGLLFVDHTSSDLLQLSGLIEVEWEPASGIAPRVLHFRLERARWIRNVGLRWSQVDTSNCHSDR